MVVPTQCLFCDYDCVLLEMPLALPYNRIKNGVCTTGCGWHIDSNGLIDRKHLKLAVDSGNICDQVLRAGHIIDCVNGYTTSVAVLKELRQSKNI